MNTLVVPVHNGAHPSHGVWEPTRVPDRRVQKTSHCQFASGHRKNTTGTIKIKRISAISFVAPNKSPVTPPNMRLNQTVERRIRTVPMRRAPNASQGPNNNVKISPVVTVAIHRCPQDRRAKNG